MSYAYLTENTPLSDILAQLLQPSAASRTDAGDPGEMSEESDLALTLRLLLEPES